MVAEPKCPDCRDPVLLHKPKGGCLALKKGRCACPCTRTFPVAVSA